MIPREERFNVVSHAIGAILAIPAAVVLIRPALLDDDFKTAGCFAVYGLTLFLMFLASTLFHSTRGKERDFYRHYDRVAIYLLIGGTYTPIALTKLPPVWNWIIILGTWAMVGLAIAIEKRPALLKHPGSVELYVMMGWMSLPILLPLARTMTFWGVAWLLLGGLLFTLGAVVVRWELLPRCHEVWHVAVLGGTACHYYMMLVYVS